MALQVTPTQKNAHTISIALSGQLDSETAGALDRQVKRAQINGADQISNDIQAKEFNNTIECIRCRLFRQVLCILL